MADAYRTKGDVTIPRVVSVEGSGENRLEITESVSYPAGSVVLAEQMTPRDRERASKGDFDHLLEPVDDVEQARSEAAMQAGGPHEDFGVFVAEHEAEAHALDVYGHHVVPKDQALELGSSSADYARDYQQVVREHGLDRRPVQEHLAQRGERVPDEVLAGGQTRTGLPHERGPIGYESERAESGDQQERAEQQRIGGRQAEAEVATASTPQAPRQRPGTPEGQPESQQGAPAQDQPAQPQPPNQEQKGD